jgi:FAD:protein FMN transferase
MNMLCVVHRCRPAMGTLFEAWLVGEDEEHLAAVGEAALDEVARLEQLLSRFDPRSEISRLNRTAAQEPVLVDVEVFGILKTCHGYWKATDGYYDIAASSPTSSVATRPSTGDIELDEQRRTVRFTHPGVRLDLGGFGKGYALDRAGLILKEFGIQHACLHGGTSSVIAVGRDEHGGPWQIGIRDPWAGDAAVELGRVEVADRGYSCSAVFGPGEQRSDVVDPHAGEPLTTQAACGVLAADALEAEILSTALLSMGKERAAAYTRRSGSARLAVAWIERAGETSRIVWL